MDGDTKTCIDCGVQKPLGQFHRRRRPDGEFGRHGRCKPCHAAEVRRYRRVKNGLPLDLPPSRGRRPSAPVGARRVASKGYIELKVAEHHRADRWGWVFEHIVVAEQKFGIKVTRDFTVHHLNGDRGDNRPENLELRWGSHGKGADVLPGLLRNPEMRAIARRVLAEYDD